MKKKATLRRLMGSTRIAKTANNAILTNPHMKVIGTTTLVNLKHVKKCDVYCGRPGAFGNPFVIGRDGSRAEVLIKYGAYLKLNKQLIERAKRELIGKVCGCFCLPEPCHVEILIGCAEES